MRGRLIASALTLSSLAIATTAAQASTIIVSSGSSGVSLLPTPNKQDCPGTGPNTAGWEGCWATQTAGVVDPKGGYSPGPKDDRVVAEISGTTNKTDQINSSIFKTVSGSEFNVTITAGATSKDGAKLDFTYTAGPGDPLLQYISIKQSDSYALFYDQAGFASGTTYEFNLKDYFGKNGGGYSHLNVYGSPGAVPEPGTWGLMLIGFAGVGFGLRRARKKARLLQGA